MDGSRRSRARGRGRVGGDRSDVTSESVLRQKEACREAEEKCRAGRGAYIQWGWDRWYNTGLQHSIYMGPLLARILNILLINTLGIIKFFFRLKSIFIISF